MTFLTKKRKSDSSNSFVMHGFRHGPISHASHPSSLSGLPSSANSGTPNSINRIRRPEPTPLQPYSTQRSSSSMPIPIYSAHEQADAQSIASSSWSEDDDADFPSNLRRVPADWNQAVELEQPYEAMYARQTYRAYKPVMIQTQNHPTGQARLVNSVLLENPGFPTLAGTYQRHFVETSQPQHQERQVFPHLLRAGVSTPTSLRAAADEEFPRLTLQESTRFTLSFEGRSRKWDIKKSYEDF